MRQLWDRVIDAATLITAFVALGVAAVVVLPKLSGQGAVRAPADIAGMIVEDWSRFADGGHRLGSAAAPITIIEFGDYQCPFCKAAEPHLEAIMRKYGADVTLVYRHLPLARHPHARAAAQAAECAGEQERFWSYHGLLYSDDDWQSDGSTEAFARLADVAEIPDRDAFVTCMEDERPTVRIELDIAAARELGFTGTPSFLVNGLQHRGVIDSTAFETIFRTVLPR